MTQREKLGQFNNMRSKLKAAIGELRELYPISKRDFYYLPPIVGGTWLVTFLASVAEGRNSILRSMVVAVFGVAVAAAALVVVSLIIILVDTNGKVSSRSARMLGFGGMNRGVDIAYMVLLKRYMDDKLNFRSYRDARRWVADFYDEAELGVEEDLAYFTRRRWRKMHRTVQNFEKTLDEYRTSGEMLAEIKEALLDGPGGWRLRHPGEEPNREMSLGVIRGWYDWEEPGGAYLHEYSLRRGERTWLVHDEAWLIEVVAERYHARQRQPVFYCEAGDMEAVKLAVEIWDWEPGGFLHQPERALRAARGLIRSRGA